MCEWTSTELGICLQQCSKDAKCCWLCIFPHSPPFLQAAWSKFISSTQKEFTQTVNPSLQREMLVSNVEKPSERGKSDRWTQTQSIPAGPMPQTTRSHLSYSHIPWTLQFSTDGKHMTDERGKMNQRWHYWGEKKASLPFFSLIYRWTHSVNSDMLQRQRRRVEEERWQYFTFDTVPHNVR